jgi:hypothetical protein
MARSGSSASPGSAPAERSSTRHVRVITREVIRACIQWFKKEQQMRHKMLQATTTAAETDAGQFEAVVATYDLDRAGERIKPGAFVGTIAR